MNQRQMMPISSLSPAWAALSVSFPSFLLCVLRASANLYDNPFLFCLLRVLCALCVKTLVSPASVSAAA